MSMRIWRNAMFVLVCAMGASLPAPALASGPGVNAAATRAYLHAESAFQRSAHAAVGMSVAAIEARVAAIGHECPSALTYAPRDAEFSVLGVEAVLTAVLAGVAPVRTAVLRLAQTIGRLSWSNHELTRIVRAQGAEERSLATRALPDVCADIAAWKASAYAVLPQATTKLFAHLETGESPEESPEESRTEAITRLLKRYERPPERRMAQEIERLEALNHKRLETATRTARKKLARALGVSAL